MTRPCAHRLPSLMTNTWEKEIGSTSKVALVEFYHEFVCTQWHYIVWGRIRAILETPSEAKCWNEIGAEMRVFPGQYWEEGGGHGKELLDEQKVRYWWLEIKTAPPISSMSLSSDFHQLADLRVHYFHGLDWRRAIADRVASFIAALDRNTSCK